MTPIRPSVSGPEANFDRADSAEIWVDHQTPTLAHTNLFALHGYSIVRWHPKGCTLVRGTGIDTQYCHGHADFTLAEWIETIKERYQHL